MDQKNLALAIAARPAGFPLRSQGEVQWLKGVAPSVGNSIEQNSQFQKDFGNQMVLHSARKAFLDSYERVKGSLDGAEQAWDTWGHQHFDARGRYTRPNRQQQNAALVNQSAKATGGAEYLGPEQ